MNNNYVVYKHTTPNGKVYIGITGKNPVERWDYGHGYRQNKHFWNAIVKYGWKNIRHEILFDGLTKQQAEQKEVELIIEYKSNQREYGYNLDNGGKCTGRHSEETKQRIRDSLLGHTVTKETHDKMCTVFVEYNGEKKTLKEWADMFDVSYKTMYARLYIYRLPIDRAFTRRKGRGKSNRYQE